MDIYLSPQHCCDRCSLEIITENNIYWGIVDLVRTNPIKTEKKKHFRKIAKYPNSKFWQKLQPTPLAFHVAGPRLKNKVSITSLVAKYLVYQGRSGNWAVSHCVYRWIIIFIYGYFIVTKFKHFKNMWLINLLVSLSEFTNAVFICIKKLYQRWFKLHDNKTFKQS